MFGQRVERLDVLGDDDFAQGAMAPFFSVASRSGMTSSASMCSSTPSPPHSGRRLNGLLNEKPRLDLRDGEAGHRAGEFLREDQPLGIGVAAAVGRRAAAFRAGEFDHRQAVGKLRLALLERIRQPRADVAFRRRAIDDHVDVVVELFMRAA